MTESLKIKTFKLTPKQIRRHSKSKDIAYAFYRPTKDQHYIVIPHKAPIKTRLHELGHCVKEHCKNIDKPLLVSEYLRQELEAELYAFEKCNKPISLITIFNTASYAMRLHSGIWANFVFTESLKVLGLHGTHLNNQQRSNLWQALKDFQKAGKPRYFENNYF